MMMPLLVKTIEPKTIECLFTHTGRLESPPAAAGKIPDKTDARGKHLRQPVIAASLVYQHPPQAGIDTPAYAQQTEILGGSFAVALVAFKSKKVIEHIVHQRAQDIPEAGSECCTDGQPFHAAPQHGILDGSTGSADGGETQKLVMQGMRHKFFIEQGHDSSGNEKWLRLLVTIFQPAFYCKLRRTHPPGPNHRSTHTAPTWPGINRCALDAVTKTP